MNGGFSNPGFQKSPYFLAKNMYSKRQCLFAEQAQWGSAKIKGTLRMYDGDGEDDANLKMCFYFTLEFLIYLDLFSVFVGIKTCLS